MKKCDKNLVILRLNFFYRIVYFFSFNQCTYEPIWLSGNNHQKTWFKQNWAIFSKVLPSRSNAINEILSSIALMDPNFFVLKLYLYFRSKDTTNLSNLQYFETKLFRIWLTTDLSLESLWRCWFYIWSSNEWPIYSLDRKRLKKLE